jgi:hypothetical protein
MKYSDDTLMAYADGELDAPTRAAIEAAMADDADLARAVERHRALAARVRSAYEGVAREPVPDRLAALVAGREPASVQALDARRRKPVVSRQRWRAPQWAALAASLLVALFIGLLLVRVPGASYERIDGTLVARGALDEALTSRLAALPGEGPVDIGISFRDRGGRYCRTFHLQQDEPEAGLACFSGGRWELTALAAAAPREDGMRTAASLPLEVLRAVDAAIEGEPLDAAAEAAARDAGWRDAPNVAE